MLVPCLRCVHVTTCSASEAGIEVVEVDMAVEWLYKVVAVVVAVVVVVVVVGVVVVLWL